MGFQTAIAVVHRYPYQSFLSPGEVVFLLLICNGRSNGFYRDEPGSTVRHVLFIDDAIDEVAGFAGRILELLVASVLKII